MIEPLGASREFEALDDLVVRISRQAAGDGPPGPRLAALMDVSGFDASCAERLHLFSGFLRSSAIPNLADSPLSQKAAANTAFIEAYFSNFIEGVELSVGDARRAVFHRPPNASLTPDERAVVATFEQLSDARLGPGAPERFEDFLDEIRARHAALMSARPAVAPGHFKANPNQAGNTVFVHPDKVIGTLRQGFAFLKTLSHPFARGAYLHFLISDIHPFVDGNGRLARIMMAAELARGRQCRVVIPTVLKKQYLDAQRALTRRSDPKPVLALLTMAQARAAEIVDADLDRCILQWASTNAFLEPDEQVSFQAPSLGVPVCYRYGVPAPVAFWKRIDPEG